jgi:hypothetical protein
VPVGGRRKNNRRRRGRAPSLRKAALNQNPIPQSKTVNAAQLESAPTGGAESIVYTGLDNIELVIGKRTAIAKVNHVIFDLGGPVVPQSIFGPDAKHPPADGLVDRDRAELHAIYAGAGGRARVSPGPAHFAVDQPIVEGVANPRSECGDPI